MATKTKLPDNYTRIPQGRVLTKTIETIREIQKHMCHRNMGETIDYITAEYVRKVEK